MSKLTDKIEAMIASQRNWDTNTDWSNRLFAAILADVRELEKQAEAANARACPGCGEDLCLSHPEAIDANGLCLRCADTDK